MQMTVNLLNDDISVTTRNPWFNNFRVSSSCLLRKYCSGMQYQQGDAYLICR